MPLTINPAVSQAQSAAINPFQQRGEDQVRTNSRREPEKTESDTRPADASASRAQESSTRNARERNEDDSRQQAQARPRGGIVDIRV